MAIWLYGYMAARAYSANALTAGLFAIGIYICRAKACATGMMSSVYFTTPHN